MEPADLTGERSLRPHMPAAPQPAALHAVHDFAERVLNLDFSRTRLAVILAAVFVAVRLPWLWTGYGAETDAYRVALVALHLWRDGEYLPSRLPGYPVHELLMAPLVLVGGSVATNAATALAALAGVLLFARIVRELRSPAPSLLVVAFAFTPLLVVNSVETKDYMWALTFMLAAYLAAIRDRPLLAGVALGLGIGCRITTGVFALPLLLVFVDRRAWRQGAWFVVATGLTAFAVFLPVTLQYGLGFLNYANSYLSPDIIIRSVGQYSIGAIGALSVVGALILSLPNLIRLPRLAVADVHVRIWLLTIALYFAAFVRLPIDIAYLIPVYPFGYLLLGRLINRYLLAAVVVVILVSGVIDLDISAMHNFDLRTFARTVRPCHSCAEYAHDRQLRTLYIHYATELGHTPIPPHTVVLTGGVFPDFAVINWNRFHYEVIDRDRGAVSMLADDGALRDESHDVLYLASPRRLEVLTRLRQQGYAFLKSDPSSPNWDVVLTPR